VRYYDPALSRFISEDPIGLAGGVNQYAYAENDPQNLSDPLGLDSCAGCWDWPFSWETFVNMFFGHHRENGDNSGSGGGRASAPAGVKPKALQKPKVCAGAAGEIQFSAGAGGLLGGVSPFGAVFVGGGMNLGFTTSGTVFLQGQATGQAGIGLFAGVGGSVGVGYSPTQLESGLTQDNSYQVQANAGLGSSVGVSTTFGGGSLGGVFTPRPSFGVGFGAQISGGPIQSVTLAYQSRLLGKVIKGLYCAVK
jgi:hypothetical protein